MHTYIIHIFRKLWTSRRKRISTHVSNTSFFTHMYATTSLSFGEVKKYDKNISPMFLIWTNTKCFDRNLGWLTRKSLHLFKNWLILLWSHIQYNDYMIILLLVCLITCTKCRNDLTQNKVPPFLCASKKGKNVYIKCHAVCTQWSWTWRCVCLCVVWTLSNLAPKLSVCMLKSVL